MPKAVQRRLARLGRRETRRGSRRGRQADRHRARIGGVQRGDPPVRPIAGGDALRPADRSFLAVGTTRPQRVRRPERGPRAGPMGTAGDASGQAAPAPPQPADASSSTCPRAAPWRSTSAAWPPSGPGSSGRWTAGSRKSIDLPDRDGKNDSMAREYDQTFEFAIPPGRHRLTLDNVGGDWACIGWYAFTGETLDP